MMLARTGLVGGGWAEDGWIDDVRVLSSVNCPRGGGGCCCGCGVWMEFVHIPDWYLSADVTGKFHRNNTSFIYSSKTGATTQVVNREMTIFVV